jgi:V/A-type H+-transporting ATPase subunit C
MRRYAYANARVKAMKSRLIPRSRMRELVDVKSASEVAAVLEQFEYKEELLELGLRHRGADLVEFALSRNLAKAGRKLLRIMPERDKPVLASLLRKWDMHNLKTIIAGKHLRKGADAIEPFLVAAGELSAALLARLLEQPDVASVIAALAGTEYAKRLQPLADAYASGKSVLPLLNALDAQYYEMLSAEALGISDTHAKALLENEIDAKNVMSIMRAKANGVPADVAEEWLVAGGSLGAGALKNLLAMGSVLEVAEAVEARFNMEKELERYKTDASLAHFEAAMEKSIAERGARALATSCLSICAVLGYLYLKEIEVGNIRKIVRAKEFALPRGSITDMVFALGS